MAHPTCPIGGRTPAEGGTLRGRYPFRARRTAWPPVVGSSAMPVQIFGTRKSAATRKAERFFAERRIPVHFVDLAERGASKGELQRFVQKFGVDALIDRGSRRFQDLGLGVARYGTDRWLEILVDEPLVLVQPLVRSGGKLTVGGDSEAEWKAWVAAGVS